MTDLPDVPDPTIDVPPPGEPVLQTVGLTKDYGRRRVVDALDLTVKAGEIYGFLGPNGAGKSTTIRMLVGLIRPTAGQARLMGHDVRRRPTAALREVGAQVESPAFYRHLSGLQNLRIFSSMTGRVSREQIERALDRVRLTGREGDRVATYSQGMRARLALALAMLPMPRLLILDEPTNGLDPQGMKEVRELVTALARDDGVTIFISSHLLHEIQQLCTRVAIIDRGRLVQAGPVGGLIAEGEQALVQVVCEPRERARAVAAALPGVRAVEDGPQGLVVDLPRTLVPELNRALVTAGIAVHELVPERMSLEEYFLHVTRGGVA